MTGEKFTTNAGFAMLGLAQIGNKNVSIDGCE